MGGKGSDESLSLRYEDWIRASPMRRASRGMMEERDKDKERLQKLSSFQGKW